MVRHERNIGGHVVLAVIIRLDDLREGMTMLEDVERIARRVLGGAHPTTTGIEDALRKTRDALESALEE